MKVFVTGGSGFVGGHVIEALATDHEVIAMARSDRSAEVVERFGATAMRCSLDDVDAEHLHGIDAVVHAAAYVEDWGAAEVFERINVEGTRRMLEAAREAGVRRFVQVSTNATLFDGTDLLDVDETHPYPERTPFPYAKTKADAEQLVLDAHGGGMSTIAIRPCFVWGPRDNSVLPSLRRTVEDGGFAWLGGGKARISTTHVHNLVAAIERALDSEETGAFFVADEDEVSVREFLTGLAATDDLQLPDRSLPAPLVRTSARLMDLAWRLVGASSPPPLTPMAAELTSRSMTVRTDRAREVLGWAPVVSRQQGLAHLAA